MGRDIDLADNGAAIFRELDASGQAAVTVDAPADLTSGSGSYAVEWFDALPGVTQVVQIDAAGKLSTVLGSGGSLDTAYDFGGPGAGRIITVDAGPVEAAGAGGFVASHSAPVYGLETTGAEYNFRLTAGQTVDVFEIQRGDQDGDISDDSFDPFFALDAVNLRLGLNTVAPSTTLHAVDAAGAKLTLESALANDSSVIFDENGTARFEVGYDQSAGGLVLGRLSFTNPAVFVEDTTGDVGINELDPDAQFHVTDGVQIVAVIESTTAQARLALVASGTADGTQVGIRASGDNLQLIAGAVVAIHIDQTDMRVGINETTLTGAQFTVRQDASTLPCILIDQNQNGEGLSIDSEATSAPLIDFLALDANTAGDLRFSNTARVSDPSAPFSGDVWFNGTTLRLMGRSGFENRTILSPYGPEYGPSFIHTIAAGVIALSRGHVILAAESGTADTLDTINAGTVPFLEGDTIVLRADSGDTITVSDGSGNIRLDGAANVILNSINDTLVLMRSGSQFIQIAFSNNTA